MDFPVQKLSTLQRFIRYSASGIGAFVIDLGILYALHSLFQVPYMVAVPLAFAVATSLHYLASRELAFKDSTRSLKVGYLYFLLIVGISAILVTSAVTLLVETVDINVYVARILTGGITGLVSFLANIYFNFRVQT